jgi:hypothetical protein
MSYGIMPEMRQVFIGGCERSGTTMLGAMLGTHNRCLCLPESGFFINILQGENIDLTEINVQPILQKIARHPRFKIWEMRLAANNWPDNQPKASYSAIIEWVVRQYGQENGKPFPDYWVDQTPNNMKYAATWLSIFPDARLIHLVRDGRAVANSLMSLKWVNSMDRAASYWLERLSYGLAAEIYYGKERVKRILYEELVSDPETILKEICNFLEIDFQAGMIDSGGVKVPLYMHRINPLVGQKPVQSRITAWEKQLSSRQVEIFENLAGDMLTFLGYRTRVGVCARGLTTPERIKAFFSYLVSIFYFYRNRFRLNWYGQRRK